MATVVGTPPGVIASGYRAYVSPPLPVTAGLVAHWDAADGSTFTYHPTGEVAEWRDKSGAGAHAAQTNFTLAPLRVTSAINGLAACSFDLRTLVTPSPSDTKPLTIIAVVRFGATVTGRTLLGTAVNTDAGGAFAWDLNAGQMRMMRRAVGTIGQTTTAMVANALTMVGCSYDAAGVWAQYKDGAANGSGTNNQTFPAGLTLSLGAASGNASTGSFGGYVAEMVKYNRVLSSTERQQIEAYLRQKWSTP